MDHGALLEILMPSFFYHEKFGGSKNGSKRNNDVLNWYNYFNLIDLVFPRIK